MTNPWKTLSALLFSLLLVAVAVADDVTFDFEPLGTIYGNPAGMSPGDFMFHEYGADLYVDEFFIVGTPYFHSATIDPAFTDPIFFGNAQTLAVNNVGIIFDFSSPGDVFFEYLNQGGSVNLQVNGFGAVLEGMDLASMAGTVAPGVTMTVTVVPVSGGGHKGVVTLTGPVTMLRIGGQELWLDTVRCNNGYVEGISGDCDYIVDHQSQPVGTTWDANTHSPGDLMFVEDGIPVFIGEIDWGTGTGFIFCDIQVTAMADFGFDRVMNINNVSNTYKISDLGITVESVSFEYVDFGGMENLQVNGATLHIGDLPTFPVAVAPGVTLSVTTYAIAGGERGEVVLTGDVQLLLLAGQEFMVDNICVKEAGSGADCDLISDNESQAPGNIWGTSYGESPGDIIFTEDGIEVGLALFDYGAGTGFNFASTDVPWGPLGTGNVMHINNIGVTYDLTPFSPVAAVRFDYVKGGGMENLSVNDLVYIGDIDAIPADFFPDFNVIVTVNVGPGYTYGTVTVTGDVPHLLVGGQEFYIDDLCVDQDAGGGLCDYEVNHQTQAVGTIWDSSTHSPGDLMFVEDGIPVFIGEIDWGSGTGFNFCDIQVTPVASFGFDRVMNINNVSNTYKIFDLGIPVQSVSFEYVDFGGMENLQINGATLHIGDLPTFPVAIAPGVTLSVTTYAISGGGERGEVVLTGDVQLLLLAGQEFMVDNICVVFDDASDVPLAAVGGIELRPNYPNPFNPNTTLRYSLAKAGHVRLSIMDIAGRRLAILVDEVRVAGDHQLVWRGLDDRGRQAASGLYFVLLESDGQVAVRKMAMLK